MAPVESLASPVTSERQTPPQTRVQDANAVVSDQHVEASPLHSDPENTPPICPTPPLQDAETPPPASFSPPAGTQIVLPGSEGSVPQPLIEPQVQYQVPHQLHVPQALFAQNPVPVQVQVRVQPPVSQPQSSVSSPSPRSVSVSLPQQQPDAAAARVSKEGNDSALQQHTQNSEFQSSPSQFLESLRSAI